MFGLKMPELLLILAIVIVLFGAKKLPALGAGVGQALRNFKKSFREEEAPEPSQLTAANAAPAPAAASERTPAAKV